MSEPLRQNELSELGPKTQAAYMALSDEAKADFAATFRVNQYEAVQSLLWSEATSGAAAMALAAPKSAMRAIGMWGFICCCVLFLVASLATLDGGVEGYIGLMLVGSAIGLFAFMWMLGAIEARLIAINETLKTQARGPV
jgi:hypothetical protein